MYQPLSKRFTLQATTLPTEDRPAMEINGERYAFQFNSHARDFFIINPLDGMNMGRAILDVHYPLIASITCGRTSYFKDALITQQYPLFNRDHHDASIMVRLQEATITTLSSARKAAALLRQENETQENPTVLHFPSPED